MSTFNLLANGRAISAPVRLRRMLTSKPTDVFLSVTDCTGAPTAAALTAYFEVLQPTSDGAITNAYPGGMWTRLDADTHPFALPEGDWDTMLADQTTTKLNIDKVVTASGSLAISIGSGGTLPHPFVVGQRISGTGIAHGASNIIDAVGSAGADGTSGSSATLRFPGITGDSNGSGKLFTNPKQWKRRILGFPTWALVLLPKFTGGASPAFTVTVSAITED
ncbi:MAG: hypothetical protein J0I33_07835 [Microbacterium ginsengisoli]|uniref:hypothetical protein n=1 Tax=Microbacterium TaxID=33882 RepID=UPI0006FB9F45|nr:MULTISPECIES: hypothetical protein [unclassified Microbacterium]KQR97707.1 hypothetical protein ASF93_13340 [Microbacterium sp. Leaf347]KQS01731.1 hypothetical protein ASG00_09865 [Microbacterium sp. Leaf351]MBN9198534.1 hypothetical protein [Microbacterium ginsengisoli]OJU78082.1 MAG: hypothetical protein BGO15_02460 [Microbacterium sp. 71-23]